MTMKFCWLLEQTDDYFYFFFSDSGTPKRCGA